MKLPQIKFNKLYQLIGGILQYWALCCIVYALFGFAVWVSREALHLTPVMEHIVIGSFMLIGIFLAVIDYLTGKIY